MVHVPEEADKRPLAKSMADEGRAEPFRDTWDAYKRTVDLSRVDTDAFRIGWPKPTIYREHEVIHVMANVIDNLLRRRGRLAARPTPPLFGGWTPTYEGDLCKGGHPGTHNLKIAGDSACNRCSRRLDLRRCLCGEESHRSGLSRSFCPNRMRFDQRDAEEHAYLWEDGHA